MDKARTIIKSSKWAKYANTNADTFHQEQINRMSKHFINTPIGVQSKSL